MKVSIICPLYNSVSHLGAMIDSLRAQTFSDFEVLIIDDCSTDGSLAKTKAVVGDDARFRFLQTQRNSGPGVTRNIGMDAAKGEYITFIDSDDQYHPQFLERLVMAVDGGKDIAYCQLAYKTGKRAGQTHRNPVVKDGVFTEESKRRFLRHFVTFSVCFIYRRDFLCMHNLRFPGLSNSEDTNFLVKTILLAETVACVDEALYYYVLHEGSLTTTPGPKRGRERLKALNLLLREYQQMKHNDNLLHLRLERYTMTMWYLWAKKGLLLSIVEMLNIL